MAVSIFDAQEESSSVGVGADPATGLTFSLDNSGASGGRGIVFMAIWYEFTPSAGGFGISDVQFDGVSLTPAAQVSAGGVKLEIWFLNQGNASSSGIEVFFDGDLAGLYAGHFEAWSLNSAGGTAIEFGAATSMSGTQVLSPPPPDDGPPIVSVTKETSDGLIIGIAGAFGSNDTVAAESVVFEDTFAFSWSSAYETTPAAATTLVDMEWSLELLGSPVDGDWSCAAIEAMEVAIVTGGSLPTCGA